VSLPKADNYTVHPPISTVQGGDDGRTDLYLLNQQWNGDNAKGRFLQVSGLSYIWDAHRPADSGWSP
jgi:5'-nucleotidase